MHMVSRFLVLLALVFSVPAMAQSFPELTGRVVDQADVIPADVEAQLTEKLAALEQQTQRQLVVATIADLEGYDVADYGYQLGRAWGIGDAERNDGALLIVAPNDKKVRIEAGYGLEGYLTDAVSSLIIQNQILPAFRSGDLPGGIVAGTDSIIQQLQLSPEEAQQVAAEIGQQRQSDGGFPFGALIWFGVIFFFFILPMLRGRGRRRYRGGGTGSAVGDIILWEVGSAILRGALSDGDDWGGGGGFGGGFGGGGGFSGGGGSFGGGGASGGW